MFGDSTNQSIMKKYLFFSGGLILLSFLFISNLTSQKAEITISTHIQWMNLEEAAQQAKNEAKPILIDVYTDWCKWCKVMDQNTFQDPEIIKYINENFYAVKLNAEEKKSLNFNGQEYKYVQGSRRGMNTITVELLGNRPSYPSLILLDENLGRKIVLKGFQKKEALLPVLSKYVKDNLLTSN